jgi:amidophosphoribosyltransferase
MNKEIIIPDKFKEECGVFGIFSNSEKYPAAITYYGLYALQHRGQESAGIATSDKNGNLKLHKNMGLVSEVFNEEIIKNLGGKHAIGHVRYSTTGSSNSNNAQPMTANCKLGHIAIAHNGNLVNADAIRDLMEDSGVIFQTSIDSEVILNLISKSSRHGLEKALSNMTHTIKGSYAIVMLMQNKLIGIRDPQGIRPLCIGKLADNYILASESCALDNIGAELIRDVKAGEIVIIDENGIHSIIENEQTKTETCSFEYIYFARPDSIIDGTEVYLARRKAGEILFKEQPVDADLVSGVPDSGISAAVGYSRASGIPYGITLIKNRYIGRTFISPNQGDREKAINVKLNALKSNVKGQRVILVDDSIVRGTTSKKLINLVRDAGAKEVHLRISSPKVLYPCYFGIDTAHRSELIASNYSVEEICAQIGADSLGFLSIEGLLESLDKNHSYCLGCFKGIYPMPAPVGKIKNRLEA